jgi:peptide-methionine (R)-S-oxide reductase
MEIATHTNKYKPNLPKRQRIAIKRLLQRNGKIIIRLADKGSGVAILTRDQYQKEAERQLNNTQHYRKLDTDITQQIRENIQRATKVYWKKGLMTEKTYNIINTPNTKPARFYTLPKIHKSITNPPGRPIMSANSHPTEKLSEYIDMHLNPFLKDITSYVKDTNHFVSICRNIKLTPKDRLITFDVASLYTNIPHQEGVDAIKQFMTPRIGKEKAEMLAALSLLVLEGNIFEFNDQLYLQTSGSAMGTKVAPSLACIFVHILETKFLKDAPIKPKIWKRYIDDIFCVIEATDDELDEFINWLNTVHPTNKFTMEAQKEGIPFLDTFLTKEEDNIIIRPYTKPTDTKQYIHPTSCHPPHIFKALPYSQALRLKRITTEKDTLTQELLNMSGYFTNRGYDKTKVQQSIEKAINGNTHTNPRKDNPITMVITYHPSNPSFAQTLHAILKHHKDKLPGELHNIFIAYKRTTNLKETLTKARFSNQSNKPYGRTKNTRLQNRPLSTYDKNQITAPIKHLVKQCHCSHWTIVDQYNSLQEYVDKDNQKCARDSTGNNQPQHTPEDHSTHPVPAIVTTSTLVKCTDCNYKYNFEHTRRKRDTEIEILTALNSIFLKQIQPKGTINRTCDKPNCKTCKNMNKERYITDYRGSKLSTIPFKCTLQNVVYCLTCLQCNQHYVGYTCRKLKDRMTIHRSSIVKKGKTAVAKHFNRPDHDAKDNFKISILDASINTSDNPIKIKEAIWIAKLQTITHGINERDDAIQVLNTHTYKITSHFNHSSNCWPYFIHTTKKIEQDNMDRFKRIIIGKK